MNATESAAVNDLCLGSDHRAVEIQATYVDRTGHPVARRSNIVRKKWLPTDDYANSIYVELAAKMPRTVSEVERVMVHAACGTESSAVAQEAVKFSPGLLRLINERRQCNDKQARRDLSKKVQRETRAQVRKWQTVKVPGRLE